METALFCNIKNVLIEILTSKTADKIKAVQPFWRKRNNKHRRLLALSQRMLKGKTKGYWSNNTYHFKHFGFWEFPKLSSWKQGEN